METKAETIIQVPEDVYKLTKKCRIPLSKILKFTLYSLKFDHETQDTPEQKI